MGITLLSVSLIVPIAGSKSINIDYNLLHRNIYFNKKTFTNNYGLD